MFIQLFFICSYKVLLYCNQFRSEPSLLHTMAADTAPSRLEACFAFLICQKVSILTSCLPPSWSFGCSWEIKAPLHGWLKTLYFAEKLEMYLKLLYVCVVCVWFQPWRTPCMVMLYLYETVCLNNRKSSIFPWVTVWLIMPVGSRFRNFTSYCYIDWVSTENHQELTAYIPQQNKAKTIHNPNVYYINENMFPEYVTNKLLR